MRAVIASFAKVHDASELLNKIITLSNWPLEGLENTLTTTSNLTNSQQKNSRISPLAMLDAWPRTRKGVDKTMQLQGDFELQEDGMGAIKQLLETNVDIYIYINVYIYR